MYLSDGTKDRIVFQKNSAIHNISHHHHQFDSIALDEFPSLLEPIHNSAIHYSLIHTERSSNMAERLYPAVYAFLVSSGFSKTAAKCLKEIEKTEAEMKTSDSLIKMYKAYQEKQNGSASNLSGTKRKAAEEESDSDEESEPEKKVVVKKKVASKEVVESSDESSEEESEPAKKVVVKKKVAAKEVVESSDESSEEESEDEDSDEDSSDEEDNDAATLARIKLKEEERKKKAIEASEAAAAWTEVANIIKSPYMKLSLKVLI